jgi:hypothetical protein
MNKNSELYPGIKDIEEAKKMAKFLKLYFDSGDVMKQLSQMIVEAIFSYDDQFSEDENILYQEMNIITLLDVLNVKRKFLPIEDFPRGAKK